MANPSKGHIKAAKRAARYVEGTKYHGIAFHSDKTQKDIDASIKFLLAEDITAMCNAKWGPQDDSVPRKNTNITLELFKTRLISGFFLCHYGPINCASKRQSLTVRSSVERKMYTIDECTKLRQSLYPMVSKMGPEDTIMNAPT
eukprot:10908707-Ditylum_brightwellii.AAC.1